MYGNTINWLVYNIDLVSSSDDQGRKNAAVNEINDSIAIGTKFTELYLILYNSIMHIMK